MLAPQLTLRLGGTIHCMALALLTGTALADVKVSAPDGFEIEIKRATDLSPPAAFAILVEQLGQWWDSAHTYSGNAQNLSMDLERQCMFEKLPDGGFVSHLQIVYYQPGKSLRLTGGLGPLQELGVHGSLVFTVDRGADSPTQIVLKYTVVGFGKQQLDALAPIVDQVLSGQMDRLQKLCAATAAATAAEARP